MNRDEFEYHIDQAGYWGVIEEESDGWRKEHAQIWRTYYLRKLGMIAMEDGTA